MIEIGTIILTKSEATNIHQDDIINLSIQETVREKQHETTDEREGSTTTIHKFGCNGASENSHMLDFYVLSTLAILSVGTKGRCAATLYPFSAAC